MKWNQVHVLETPCVGRNALICGTEVEGDAGDRVEMEWRWRSMGKEQAGGTGCGTDVEQFLVMVILSPFGASFLELSVLIILKCLQELVTRPISARSMGKPLFQRLLLDPVGEARILVAST